MTSATPRPPSGIASSHSSLPSSPVASLPFIRRLFVTDSASSLSSPVRDADAFHPSPYRRHSFAYGTTAWICPASPTAQASAVSSFQSSHSLPSAPFPFTSASATSSPMYAGSGLPPLPQLSGLDAFDLSAPAQGGVAAPFTKSSKLLEKLCKFEWDFS